MPRRPFFAASGGVLALLLAASLATAGAPVAVVTDVSGSATVERAGATQPLVRGMPLEAGDVVVTAEGARATVLFRNGAPLTLGSGARETIGTEAGSSEGAAGGALARLASGGYASRDMTQLGAVRAGEDDLRIVAPGHTSLIPGESFELRWAPSQESVQVQVFDEDEELIWESGAAGDHIAYGGPALGAGQEYLVVVERSRTRSSEAELTVLSDAEAEAARSGEAAIEELVAGLELASGDLTRHVLLAGHYSALGMHHRAASILEEARAIDPDDPGLRDQLRGAYLTLGNADAAAALGDR